MRQPSPGIIVFVAIAVVFVGVSGCTRPMSTGPLPKPQAVESPLLTPTAEAMPTSVVGTVIAGATATAVSGTPRPTVPPPAPTATLSAPRPTAPAATPTPTAVPGGATSYTVKPGDWLFSIGRQFNVSPYAIAQANGLVPPYRLHPGQVLIIPGGPGPGPGPSTYTVRPGDTIYSIARRLGKSVAAIINANNLVNPNLIFPGQVLKIP